MKINKPLSAALAAAGLGYAIGNLNPAYVMGLRKGYDIRKKGSGNAGATNLMILEGKKAGAFVMCFDISKAAVSVGLARKLFLPAPIRFAYTAVCSVRYLWHGLRSLLHRRLEVEVLDALSIGVSMLRGDFSTAGSVMFLLGLSALLEDYTRKRTQTTLTQSLAIHVDTVWRVAEDGSEESIPMGRLALGERIRVRSGALIPVDGTVGEQLADFRVELQDSSRTAGGLNVRAQVKADAAMALQETARLITEAAVQEQKPVKQRGAGCLTLYFPEPGEQVWEIAKRYSTAPAAILEENGLTDDGAAGEGMLLIPAVR